MTIPALSRRWSQLFPETDQSVVQAAFHELQEHYEEEGRYYHTLDHIGQMLEAQERYFPRARREQILAIFLHDLIYDAERPDNEERSAEVGSAMIRPLNVPEASVAQVASLILCTKTHQATTAQEMELCDLDLYPLGIPAADYQANTTKVRKEYAFATDAQWAQGRTQFIDSFLARPFIYHNERVRADCEAAVRRNLAHERSLLATD